MTRTVTPDTLYDRLREGSVSILEVGTDPPTAGYDAVTLADDDPLDESVIAALTDPVVVIDDHGDRGAAVAATLADAGVTADHLVGGRRNWLSFAVDRPLAATDGAVVQVERPATGCLSYLVVDGDAAAVIDPLAAIADRYPAIAADHGATIRWGLDTHIHDDHVSGRQHLAATTDATPVLPVDVADGVADTRGLADGETLPIGDGALTAVAVPGHTPETTAARWGSVFFTSDALHLDAVGRPTRAAGDDAALGGALYDSLHDRLLPRPRDTIIAPGHAPPTARRAPDETLTATLNTVRKRTHLKYLNRPTFVEHVTTGRPAPPPMADRITAINRGSAPIDHQTAVALDGGVDPTTR